MTGFTTCILLSGFESNLLIILIKSILFFFSEIYRLLKITKNQKSTNNKDKNVFHGIPTQ